MPSTIDTRYKSMRTLSKTNFKVVKLCLDKEGNSVVLQIFRKNAVPSDTAWNELQNYIQLYQAQPSHPNLTKLLDYSLAANEIKSDGRQLEVAYAVFELASGGQL